MTDEPASPSGTPYVKKRVAAYLKRREEECILILARAYIDVATKLNGDVSRVFQLFHEFTTTAAKASVPPRRRGKADPELDAHILHAGDAAPRGQKEMAVADAAGARTVKDMDAARRRYNRLRAERDAHDKWVAEVVAAVRPKLRRWSRKPLLKITEQAPRSDPAEGDKYPR
jgi:hypothetical protein